MKRIIFGIIIIVLGVGVASIPFVKNMLDERQGVDLIKSIEAGTLAIDVPVLDVTLEELDVWDFQSEAVKAIQGEIAAPTPNPSKTKKILGIGVLQIDKINLSQPLVEGCGKTELQYACGHLTNTAFPGQEGNCVVAGHRNYTYGKMFNRLEEVGVGDTIVIVSADKIRHTYEVDNTLVTEPGDSSILTATPGEKRLTLITCTPVVTATHRFIVQAKLVSSEPVQQDT